MEQDGTSKLTYLHTWGKIIVKLWRSTGRCHIVTSPMTPPHRRTEWLNEIQQWNTAEALVLLWVCPEFLSFSLSLLLTLTLCVCVCVCTRACVCVCVLRPDGTSWINSEWFSGGACVKKSRKRGSVTWIAAVMDDVILILLNNKLDLKKKAFLH